MSVDIAAYQARSYPAPPCWALVADVYLRELQQPVDEFKTVNQSVRAIASAFRLALSKTPSGFVQVAGPQEFAVVLLGRFPKLGLHHCGVIINGSVLHATESGVGGVKHQPLSSIQDTYRLIEYWARA